MNTFAALVDEAWLDIRKDWTEEQWAQHDARIAAAQKRDESERVTEERRAQSSRLSEAGWPLRAIEAAQGADLEKPAIARVMAWDTNTESVLVLSGPPGCGKTTAAARWAVSKYWPPKFVRATTFASSSRYDRDTRDTWLKADALVLDDLGAEYADTKGNFLVDLDELVDTFYGDKRPLLITTNCSAEEFKQRYGQRVIDRLRECGSWFSANNASLRRKP